MRPDHLSELFEERLAELIKRLGKNESLIIEVLEGKGIKLSRKPNITFWQAFLAVTWFPILVAGLSVYLWKTDESKVVINYVRANLAVTITGLFGAWVIGTLVVGYLFRFIRQS